MKQRLGGIKGYVITMLKSLALVTDVKPNNCFILNVQEVELENTKEQLEDFPLEISMHTMIGTLSPQTMWVKAKLRNNQ